MNSVFIIFAIAIMVVAALMLVSKLIGRSSRTKTTKSGGARPSKTATRWRSVRIKPGLICCSAASKMSSRIFLASESPRIPLPGCGEKDCRCKYLHMEDRRSGRDRRIELGDLTDYMPMNQEERRRLSGRRTADLAA